MNLKLKLISGFLAVSSLVAILGAINIQTDRQVNRQFNQITAETVPELIELNRIKVASLTMINKAFSYTVIHLEEKSLGTEDNFSKKERKDFQEAVDKLEERLIYLDNLEKQIETEKYEEIKQSYLKFYEQIYNPVITLTGKTEKAPGVFFEQWQRIEAAKKELLAAIDRAIDLEIESLAKETGKANQSADRSLIINLSSVTLLLAISIIIGFVLAEKITKPIIQLKEAAWEIGSGELDTKVDIQTGDEIEILANSFNQMVGKLTETTVSKSYLNNIISSLSDGLLVSQYQEGNHGN